MNMRTSRFVLVTLGAVATASLAVGAAQAPARGGAGATAPAARLHANLAQVMRGILFPNSNVIFAAQSVDPATIKPADDPATSPDPLSSVYGGWQAVENSGLALAESANLLIIPGRMCQNGRPVPMQNADWQKWVEGLRAAGMSAYKAGQAKNQDAVLDAAGEVADACANCHNKYRDVPMRCQ
jgi:hypothetical protein